MCIPQYSAQETKHKDIPPEIKALKDLARNIDITRRNRMNAADRLVEQEQFLQRINIYYSCVAAIISILCLVNMDYLLLSIASTVVTVVLSMSIAYLNAQHYGERAKSFHSNFLALYQLLFDTRKAIRKYSKKYDIGVEEKEDSEKDTLIVNIEESIEKEEMTDRDINEVISKLEKRYVDLLSFSENHADSDFIQTEILKDRIEKRKNKNYKAKIYGIEKAKYVLAKWFKNLLKVLLWIAPIIFFTYIIFVLTSSV